MGGGIQLINYSQSQETVNIANVITSKYTNSQDMF